MTPLIGSTVREFPHYIYPLIDVLSKEKGRGTSSRFLRRISSLFFPPRRRGPKFTLPVSKNTLGSITSPTTRKC